MPLVIELRAAARKNKNFAVADKIRDGLGPIGITLEDRAGGTEWSGGGATAPLDGIMKLLIQLRADARAAKDFATGDADPQPPHRQSASRSKTAPAARSGRKKIRHTRFLRCCYNRDRIRQSGECGRMLSNGPACQRLATALRLLLETAF